MGFFNFNFTGTEQECIVFKLDVGVDDEKETTATTQQAAVREEFTGPTKKRQRHRTTGWTTEQSKQFNQGKSQ